jgi:hypothetical protein
MKRVLGAAAVLALVGCGEPPPGSGVHQVPAAELQAQVEAEYRAGDVPIVVVEQRLRALGVRPEEMRRVPDPDYGIAMIELAISPQRLATLDAAALARLDLDTNRRLTLADPVARRRFAEIAGEEDFAREQAQAIAELKQAGDWERAPRRRGREPMSLFAPRVERWCGYPPGQALQVIDGAWLLYNQRLANEVVMEPRPGRKRAQFDCLRRIVYATDLRWNFVGYR